MSFTTPSTALVAVGERRRGVAIVLLCLLGFGVGQVIALILGEVALALAHSTLTLKDLASLDRPPWWWTSATFLGLWTGWLTTVVVIQSQFQIIDVSGAFRFRWPDLWWVIGAAVLQFGFLAIYELLGVHGTSNQANKIVGTSSGWSLALICALTIIVAPAVEEIFFRGTLLVGLRDLCRQASHAITAVMAISIDAILFGLAHAEWVLLPGLVAVGVVLAWLYWHYGRLVPGFILHSSFNALGLIFAINVHAIR